MKKRIIILPLLLIVIAALPIFAAKENYSTERWHSFGASGAIVLASEDNKDDSRFYGLIVERSGTKRNIRISVKDIHAMPGDFIRWETDKEMGSIANKGTMVIRTDPDDIKLNQRLLDLIKSGEWIQFENVKTGSIAKYKLTGALKAISSIK
tara:strand:- start:7168 stop:7623 length:456 start_codon:yes stop_codon:yes gene_type:complete